MANQIPIKVMCDGSGNTCGLAQFTSSDSVAIAAGGTGLTSQGICEFVQPGLYAVGCQVTYLGICAGKADTGVGHLLLLQVVSILSLVRKQVRRLQLVVERPLLVIIQLPH